MATKTVGDAIVERLREWDVERIFGYPGDGINGILSALQRAGNQPPFVQSRHEEMSAFHATGYAKFQSKVGVCLATSGPGAVHLLNGLYDAKLDHVGVVAIVGQQARTSLGGNYQQEIDLVSLFKDVAGSYVHMASTPEQFPMLIDRAMRIAHAERTPTCVIVPADLQDLAYEPPAHAFKMVPSSIGYAEPIVTPPDDEIRRAADVLNSGERVAILVGQGARRTAGEVLAAADTLGSCAAKALLGKDVLPDDNPLVTGAIGLLGTKPSDVMMSGCDTLLMIGSSFPYGQFLPDWDQARGVQIELDAKMVGLRYPMEVNLVGDAKATMEKLLPLLERKTDRSWQEMLKAEIEEWWGVVESRAMLDAEPVNPQRVFWELSSRLPDNAIITTDSGSAANWYARDLKIREGMRASLSGTLATMGPGVPYAIGAKFAHPDRPVFALVGDGAMQMNGMNELLTIAKYWRQWSDPRLIVLVLNNHDLNQVTWEMRAMEGDPMFEASQELPSLNYADFARLVGLSGIRVETPEQVGPAWDQAVASTQPIVVDAVTSPNVPPIPPHIEWDEAKKLFQSMVKGDPEGPGVVKQGVKQKLQEFMRR